MNFNNEFYLFEMNDPAMVFSLIRGYWEENASGRESLYTLDDRGFYIAIFQRAYILYEVWKLGEISDAKYRSASLSSNRIKSRFLTDFNFVYYSEKLERFFVCIHRDAAFIHGHEDELKKIDHTFECLSKLHDIPSIVRKAAELWESCNEDSTDKPDCWGTLYANGFEL